MNPLRIIAANYRSFPDLDLDLPQGCIAVLGENGAGKSSIVNAIDLTIFGPESRSLADALSDTSPHDDLLLELELEHAGAVYRVRRTYSPRGRGKTSLDFEKQWSSTTENGRGLTASAAHAQGWEPLTRESAKETQALIEQTLGLSRETFRASAFLAQGDGAAFTEAQPRDRKKILAEVLGLDRYDTLLKRARTEKQAVDGQLQQLAGRTAQTIAAAAELPQLERDHQAITEAVTVTADTLADLERSHTETAAEYTAAREHAAGRAAAEAELREAQSTVITLTARDEQAANAARDRATAASELNVLPADAALEDLEATRANLDTARSAYREQQAAAAAAKAERDRAERERAEARTTAGALNERASALRATAAQKRADDDATCQTCGQHIADAAKEKAVAELAKTADECEEKARACEEQAANLAVLVEQGDLLLAAAAKVKAPDEAAYASVVAAIEAARANQAKRATLEERIRQCEALAAAGPSADALVTAKTLLLEKRDAVTAIGAPPDLDAITARGNQIAEQLRSARTDLERQKTEGARLEERLKVARVAAETAVELEKNSESLRADLDVLAQLERAFSPNGIPALIVENSAVPYLETEATRILAALGTSYRIGLRTQAALKSGEGLRDTLDVIVCGENGDRPYETFSGGERTRINLALRIALARLLAHRRGAESRLLAIDEPEFLDEHGTAALVDVLRELEGDFDRLYLISHVPALRDAFDQVLTVVKDETGSRVTDGYEAVLEAAVV